MPSTNSQSQQAVTILKRSLGALMALISGLLMVGIGLFILALLANSQNPGISSSQSGFSSFFVVPLTQACVVTIFAFFAAASR
jgi:hypothetical protein